MPPALPGDTYPTEQGHAQGHVREVRRMDAAPGDIGRFEHDDAPTRLQYPERFAQRDLSIADLQAKSDRVGVQTVAGHRRHRFGVQLPHRHSIGVARQLLLGYRQHLRTDVGGNDAPVLHRFVGEYPKDDVPGTRCAVQER